MQAKANNIVQPELPKQNPYDPKFFWKVSISELLADAAIILYAFFFSGYLFKDVNILTAVKPWQLLGLYTIVVLILPWYLGYLYAHFEAFYSKTFCKIILWIFILIVLATLGYLLAVCMSIPWTEEGKTDKITENFAMFSLFLLVLGPMMALGGVTAGQDDFAKHSGKFDPENPSVTSVILIIVCAIGFLVWGMSFQLVKDHIILFILVYLGCSIPAILLYLAYIKLMVLLDKWGVYESLTSFASYSFPFFIVSVLIFWNGIGMHVILNIVGSNGISFRGLITSLVITGVIPFRLIMLLTPPLRLINIVIGIAAFVLFIVSLKQVCV
jgi:hypothetical protein